MKLLPYATKSLRHKKYLISLWYSWPCANLGLWIVPYNITIICRRKTNIHNIKDNIEIIFFNGVEKKIFGVETNTIGAEKENFGAQTDECILEKNLNQRLFSDPSDGRIWRHGNNSIGGFWRNSGDSESTNFGYFGKHFLYPPFRIKCYLGDVNVSESIWKELIFEKQIEVRIGKSRWRWPRTHAMTRQQRSFL